MIEKTWKRDGYTITTLHEDIDLDRLHYFLSIEAYWSKNMPRDVMELSVKNSLPFSILSPDNEFVGFARLVTDYATFAYLGDVYIDTNFRGLGLGKWLIEIIMGVEELQVIRNWMLYTRDAHELYKKFGWIPIDRPERAMVKRKSNPYG